jgi:hypothetical protein
MVNFGFQWQRKYGKANVMSDLYMFRDGQPIKEVKETTKMYESSSGMQDVFMQCLKEAYKMGYLEWKNDDMQIALESLLNRHIIYCGGEPDLSFAGHHDVELFNLCKVALERNR